MLLSLTITIEAGIDLFYHVGKKKLYLKGAIPQLFHPFDSDSGTVPVNVLFGLGETVIINHAWAGLEGVVLLRAIGPSFRASNFHPSLVNPSGQTLDEFSVMESIVHRAFLFHDIVVFIVILNLIEYGV